MTEIYFNYFTKRGCILHLDCLYCLYGMTLWHLMRGKTNGAGARLFLNANNYHFPLNANDSHYVHYYHLRIRIVLTYQSPWIICGTYRCGTFRGTSGFSINEIPSIPKF